MNKSEVLPRELLKAFESVPDLYLILSPDLVILTASDAYLKATLTQREAIVGRHLFEVFPDNPATPDVQAVKNLRDSLNQVLVTKKPHRMNLQQFDVPNPDDQAGGFAEKFWLPVNTPVLDEDGEVYYIIHKVKDVTEMVLQEHRVISPKRQVDRQPQEWKSLIREYNSDESIMLVHFLDRYRLIVDNVPDAISRWDPNLKLIFANAAFQKKADVNLTALFGKTNLEIGQPEYIAGGWTEKIQGVFHSGNPVEHYNSFPTPGGEAFFYSRLVPEFGSDGKVESVLVIARDITDLKKTEKELRGNRSLLKATLDSSLDMIQVFKAIRDENNRIIDFKWILNNHASEKVYGDVIGKRLLALNPGVMEAGIFDSFIKVVETGEPRHYEQHYLHEQFDGWYFQSVVKLDDGVVTTTADITARKRAELGLRESKAFAEGITNTIPDLISIHDAVTNQIIYTNHDNFWGDSFDEAAIYKMKDLERAEVMVHPDYQEKVKIFLKERWSLADDEVAEVELRLKTGKIEWISIRSKVFKRDETGAATQVISFTKDITGHKKAEQTIQQMLNGTMAAISLVESVRDQEGKIIDFIYRRISKAAEPIYRISSEEIIGKSFLELFPDLKDLVFQEYVQIVETGIPNRMVFLYPEEGFDKWFDMSAVKNGDGLIITTLDITPQKQAEIALRKNTELLQSIFNAPNIGITVYEAVRNEQGDIVDFRFMLLNQRTIDMYGKNPIGKRLLEEFPGNAMLIDDYKRVVETGKLHEHEVHYQHEGFDNWFYLSECKLGDGLVIQWQDITEQKKAELDLLRIKEELARRATDKYLALFNNMEQGFCIIEMIFDDADKPVDYRFLEINPVFEKQTGLKDALGKTMRELQPAHEEHWFEIYGKVAKTGEPIHFENLAAHLQGGIWYEVYAVRIGNPKDNQVAVLFNDITERKYREADLSFLAEITEDFSRLSTAQEIMQIVGAKIGAYMNLSTCNFLEIDETKTEDLKVCYTWGKKNAPSMPEKFPMEEYLGEEIKRESYAGETTVIRNTQTDAHTKHQAYARLHVNALVGVPFHRNGKWKYLLTVTDSQPRNWRQDEIRLIQEMSNRLFMRLERARAEEALRESEERLRKAISIDTVGVLFFNLNGRIMQANKAFERMSSYTQEELLTTVHWQVLTPPEFREATAKAAGELAERGETAPYEKQLFRRDGSRWWGLFAPTRLSGSGLDSECVEFIIDITERKKAEQQLQEFNTLLEQQVTERTRALIESKERFEAAINISPVALGILKSIRNEQQEIIDFYFEWVSKSTEKLAQKDITGLWLTKQFPYLRQIGVFQKYVNTAETGEPMDFEYLYKADGYNLWIHWKAEKLEDGLFVSVEDISERKQAELEVMKNLTLLKQSEEVANTGSWEYDIITGQFNWSEGMYRLLGLPVGSPVSPKTYLDYVIEEDLPVAQRIVSQIQERHEPVEETLRLQVKGQVLTLRVKAVVFRNEAGAPIKILGVDLDITEVKRLEKENLQMRLNQQKNLLLAILEAQEEERRRISESLHNGVGQILYATKLNLDQIARQMPPGAMQTTEKLLNDAITETRRVSHELVPVVLKDFGLAEALVEICNKYNQGSLQITCKLDGLQSRLEPYQEVALYRISQELLNNTVKHAQATKATLHLSKRADRIILQVQDNGKGLDKEALNTTGIGLRTIRDRVKLLNGTFTITTPKSGKGTLITIRIPAK